MFLTTEWTSCEETRPYQTLEPCGKYNYTGRLEINLVYISDSQNAYNDVPRKLVSADVRVLENKSPFR